MSRMPHINTTRPMSLNGKFPTTLQGNLSLNQCLEFEARCENDPLPDFDIHLFDSNSLQAVRVYSK